MRPLLILVLSALVTPALAQPAPAADPARVEQVIAATFAHAPPAWAGRVTQDETQRLCSLRRNEPTAAESAAIVAREAKTVALPADGKLLGDWKRGAAIAQNGQGGQFSDAPGTVSGGNCYACHQIDAAEISYGTIGPSLVGYGRLKDYTADAARAAYAKVFNPQAVLACSTMPRFGHNGILTEQQMKDVVAYLLDPASPVNAP
jgi:sulfur-oxidizing protein SoxX